MVVILGKRHRMKYHNHSSNLSLRSKVHNRLNLLVVLGPARLSKKKQGECLEVRIKSADADVMHGLFEQKFDGSWIVVPAFLCGLEQRDEKCRLSFAAFDDLVEQSVDQSLVVLRLVHEVSKRLKQ